MPTITQVKTAKRVAEYIQNQEVVDGKDILALVGYGKGMQKNPGKVFESKGFKEAMKQLGFSLEAADLTVASILRKGKDENKLNAADKIYKRLSGYAAEKHINISVEITKEERERARKALEEMK